MFRLGTSLTQSFPAPNNNNPRSRASSMSRCGSPSRISTMPRIKPQPRIGPTDFGNHPESLSRRRYRRADVLLTCETNSRWLNRFKTWSPILHARGDPPNVVPCVPVPNVSADHHRSIRTTVPAVIVSLTASRISTAPMGYPFANGFAMVTISGWHSTGQAECAHKVPVLYSPHCAHIMSNAVSASSWNERLGSDQNSEIERERIRTTPLAHAHPRVTQTPGS